MTTLLIGLASFSLVITQLRCLDILAIVIGHTIYGEVSVIVLSFIGILIGFAIPINTRRIRFFILLNCLFHLLFSFIYSEVLILSIINKYLACLVVANIFFTLVVSSALLTCAAYDPLFNDKRYRAIQWTSAGVVILNLGLMSVLPKNMFHVLIGFSLLGVLLLTKTEKKTIHKIAFSQKDLLSILFGLSSGVFINYYFNVTRALVYPSGLEFHYYLILIFLFFGMSSFLLEKKYFKIDINSAYVISAVTAVIVLFIFTGQNTEAFFYFDPVKFSMKSNLLYYPILSFLIIGILLLPYLFISVSVPALQKENVSKNYIFYTTFGSTIGQIFMSLPMFDFTIKSRLLIFIFLILFITIYVNYRSTKNLVFVGGLAALIGFVYFEIPNSVESVLSNQARRMYATYWTPYAYRPILLKIEHRNYEQDIVKRVGNKIGVFGPTSPYLKFLTLDGYSAETFLPHDYIKSLVVEKIAHNKSFKKILVLGLGNHIVLKKIQTVSPKATIDVVDNSPFFQDPVFLDRVALEANFSWHPTVRLFSEDAFHYIFKNKIKYDLIVWNLTLPNYLDSLPLFTKEFANQMGQSLTEQGMLVLPFYYNSFYDCTNAGLYQGADFYFTRRPVSLVVFEKNSQDKFNIINNKEYVQNCNFAVVNSLSSITIGRQFDSAVIQNKRFMIENFYQNQFNSTDQKKVILNFIQSINYETQPEKFSLIINSSKRYSGAIERPMVFSKTMSSDVSMSFLDNYDSIYEQKKIEMMLEIHVKENANVLSLFSDITDDDHAILTPRSQDSSQAVSLKKTSYLKIDEEEYFKEEMRLQKANIIEFIGNTKFKNHYDKITTNINSSNPKHKIIKGKRLIWLALENENDLEKYLPFVANVNKSLVYVWLPPTVNNSKIKTELKGQYFQFIDWMTNSCDGDFKKAFEHFIENTYEKHIKTYVIHPVQKRLSGLKICRFNLTYSKK